MPSDDCSLIPDDIELCPLCGGKPGAVYIRCGLVKLRCAKCGWVGGEGPAIWDAVAAWDRAAPLHRQYDAARAKVDQQSAWLTETELGDHEWAEQFALYQQDLLEQRRLGHLLAKLYGHAGAAANEKPDYQ